MKTSYHICLDPGHGPGCANRSPDGSYEEQEFTMDLAERMAALLRVRGIDVSFTRNAKEYPSLSKRCEIANAISNLDLFVSVHSNASGNGWSDAHGHLVFTSGSGEGEKRNQAGRAILRAWEEFGIPLGNNPLRHDAFAVLTNTQAPAILLEHGFHTNREELAMLKNSAFRARLAEADARGIAAYFGVTWGSPESPWRARVAERFDLQTETLDCLESYCYGKELLQKLAEGK